MSRRNPWPVLLLLLASPSTLALWAASPPPSQAPAALPSSPVFAQPLTEASRPAMLKAADRIAANPVVAGDFVQTKRVLRLKKNFVSSGDFIFSGQYGVFWHVTKPLESTVVMTADRLIQKSADGRSSSMDAQGNAVFKRFADIIQAVFAGRIASIESEFELYFIAGKTWQLGLVPREPAVRKVIAAMEIEGERSIERFRLTEPNGDYVVYEFRNSRFPASLSQAEIGLFQ